MTAEYCCGEVLIICYCCYHDYGE